MDRTEFQKTASDTETAANFLDEIRASSRPESSSSSSKVEAQEIANYFDRSKAQGQESYGMEEGAARLSSNLQKLSNDMPAYNSLLKDLQESIKSIKNTDYPATPELVLKDFDEKIGTYKNAYIYVNADSWDSHEAFRIVQPGNTLSQIAKDSYDAKVVNNEGEPLGYSLADFKGFITEKNNIADPNLIKVGQTLKMYVF